MAAGETQTCRSEQNVQELAKESVLNALAGSQDTLLGALTALTMPSALKSVTA